MIKRKDSNNRVLRQGESQRPNGTYEYKYKDASGTRRSLYAKTLDDLRVKAEKVNRDKIDGINNWGGTHTVNELIEKWFALKFNLRDSTRATYLKNYELHIKNDIGRWKVNSVKKSNISEFYLRLLNKGLRASTIQITRNILTQAFEVAVGDDIIRSNPVIGAHKGLLKKSNDALQANQALTMDQQEELMRFIKESKYSKRWPIIQFLLWTGMRIGEVCGLTWDDVDLDNNVVHVRKNLVKLNMPGDEKSVLKIHAPKSKCGLRDIPLVYKAREALIEERRRQSENGIRCTEPVEGIDNFVFLKDNGRVMQAFTVDSCLDIIVAAYNKNLPEGKEPLPKISNHVFRHTFATRMCEAGVDPKAMQVVMGHSDVSTTFDVYVNLSPEFIWQQMLEMARSLNG